MIITTTPSIEGKRITEYLGIVTGEAIMGVNIFRDFFANIRDIIGGRAGSYEEKLIETRQIALKEMEDNAAQLDADAVVGVDIFLLI